MKITESNNRENKAIKLLQKVKETYFCNMSCDAHTLYNKEMKPVEFYGKIYKKEFFWRRFSFLMFKFYLPYIKETRFLEIRLTGPVSFSGFTMKFSELVRVETSVEINELFILHKFWINCNFQHK